MNRTPAQRAALQALRDALYLCEGAGLQIVTGLAPEGAYLQILGEADRVLWDGQDHGGQHYLNGAAAELARMTLVVGPS